MEPDLYHNSFYVHLTLMTLLSRMRKINIWFFSHIDVILTWNFRNSHCHSLFCGGSPTRSIRFIFSTESYAQHIPLDNFCSKTEVPSHCCALIRLVDSCLHCSNKQISLSEGWNCHLKEMGYASEVVTGYIILGLFEGIVLFVYRLRVF